jgi:hypothetical protein
MKKVSEADTSALSPGIFTAQAPATRPSPANNNALSGGGCVAIACSEETIAAAPKTMTAPT